MAFREVRDMSIEYLQYLDFQISFWYRDFFDENEKLPMFLVNPAEIFP